MMASDDNDGVVSTLPAARHAAGVQQEEVIALMNESHHKSLTSCFPFLRLSATLMAPLLATRRARRVAPWIQRREAESSVSHFSLSLIMLLLFPRRISSLIFLSTFLAASMGAVANRTSNDSGAAKTTVTSWMGCRNARGFVATKTGLDNDWHYGKSKIVMLFFSLPPEYPASVQRSMTLPRPLKSKRGSNGGQWWQGVTDKRRSDRDWARRWAITFLIHVCYFTI